MNEMRCFVRVAELGSFAAAAEAMGLTPSAISKIISRLEDRLRARLLTRTTRRLALTGEGQVYLAHCREILMAVESMENALCSATQAPRGDIRLNTGTAIGKHFLTPLVPEFLALYPEIRLDLSITDRQIDLVAENVDVVLRTGELADSNLHAVRLGENHRRICASPTYLARAGTPKLPADLLAHNCLLVSHAPHLAAWPFHTPEGINRMRVSGNVTADNADMLLDLALDGVGIVRFGNMLVDAAIERGRLVPLLEPFHVMEPFPIWAVMPPGRFRLHRVRVLLDFLGTRLRPASPGSSAL